MIPYGIRVYVAMWLVITNYYTSTPFTSLYFYLHTVTYTTGHNAQKGQLQSTGKFTIKHVVKISYVLHNVYTVITRKIIKNSREFVPYLIFQSKDDTATLM